MLLEKCHVHTIGDVGFKGDHRGVKTAFPMNTIIIILLDYYFPHTHTSTHTRTQTHKSTNSTHTWSHRMQIQTWFCTFHM